MNDFRLDTLKKKDFNNEIEADIFRFGRVEAVEQMIANACIDAGIIEQRHVDRALKSISKTNERLLAIRQLIASKIKYGTIYNITLKKKNFHDCHCTISRGASRLVVIMELTVYKMVYDKSRFDDQNKKEASAFKKALHQHPEACSYIAGLYQEFNQAMALISVKAHSVGLYNDLREVCDATGYDYYNVMNTLDKIGVSNDLHQFNIGIYQGKPCVVDYGL